MIWTYFWVYVLPEITSNFVITMAIACTALHFIPKSQFEHIRVTSSHIQRFLPIFEENIFPKLSNNFSKISF